MERGEGWKQEASLNGRRPEAAQVSPGVVSMHPEPGRTSFHCEEHPWAGHYSEPPSTFTQSFLPCSRPPSGVIQLHFTGEKPDAHSLRQGHLFAQSGWWSTVGPTHRTNSVPGWGRQRGSTERVGDLWASRRAGLPGTQSTPVAASFLPSQELGWATLLPKSHPPTVLEAACFLEAMINVFFSSPSSTFSSISSFSVICE